MTRCAAIPCLLGGPLGGLWGGPLGGGLPGGPLGGLRGGMLGGVRGAQCRVRIRIRRMLDGLILIPVLRPHVIGLGIGPPQILVLLRLSGAHKAGYP